MFRTAERIEPFFFFQIYIFLHTWSSPNIHTCNSSRYSTYTYLKSKINGLKTYIYIADFKLWPILAGTEVGGRQARLSRAVARMRSRATDVRTAGAVLAEKTSTPGN